MLRRLCAVVVLVASVPIALAPAGDADPPATSLSLPTLAGNMPTVNDLLVDQAHDQILIAGYGGIDVASADGASATHVSSPTSVGGLALSDDASTLWYSSITDGALVATDAAHLSSAARHSHSLPNGQCPSKIAVDGTDRVWFLYASCAASAGSGGLGVYDPATDQFDLHPAVASGVADLSGLGVLANNAGNPNTLVVASASDTTSIDVSAGTTHTDEANPEGADAVAVTSDGTRFARADGEITSAPTADPGSTTDTVTFDPDGTATNGAELAVALSADDAHVAGAYGSDVVSFGTADGDRTWIRRCEVDTPYSVYALAWDGPDVWLLAGGASLMLERCTGMATPQSFIATPPSETLQAGTQLSVPLRLAYRDVPIADATITVQRAGDGKATLPDLTTDTDGDATLHDVVRRGHIGYLVSFAGDDTHPPYSTTYYVNGTTEPTTLSGDNLGEVRADHRVSIYGTLSGSDYLASKKLHVVRIDAAGRHRLPDVTTRAGGVFTVTDRPHFGPTTRYLVSFPGDAGHLPCHTTYSVEVDRLRPVLSISLQHKAIWYNQHATVQIHLGPTYRNRMVTLYAVPAQRGKHRVLTAGVNRHGNLVADVPMSRNTTFFAEFKGDPRYNSREVSVTELSGLLPSVRLAGGYATSGKYRLYRAGTEIKQIGKLLPAQAGRCLRFNAAHRSGGKWVEDAASDCIATNRKGIAVAYFHTPQPKLRVPYVFQSYFEADGIHTGSTSAGALAKFTAASASARASARTPAKGFWTIRR